MLTELENSAMNERATQCPKCQGLMERGFLPNVIQGGLLVMNWVQGVPHQTFWSAVQPERGSDKIPVGAFRCQTCGFLEFYARTEFAAQ